MIGIESHLGHYTWPPQATTAAHAAGRVGGASPTAQSRPRQPARGPRDQEIDEVSMASFDPRARQDQWRAPEDRRREGAHVTIEQCRDTLR